jgi:hypothetical protein
MMAMYFDNLDAINIVSYASYGMTERCDEEILTI